MHVAEQLSAENIQVSINGTKANVDALFPNAHKYDRFGFILDSPLGSLGASLLIQAAIVQFYDAVPERRTSTPMYPEIYMFHVGGKFGDHSSFDFWPPRKEVFIEKNDPVAILQAINERGITRLAIPNSSGGDAAALCVGPSTWAEQAAAQNLLASCFVYSPCGNVENGDVQLESSHPSFEANPASALDINTMVKAIYAVPEELRHPGPTVAVDVDRWVEQVKLRMDEVDPTYSRELACKRLCFDSGQPMRRESYRRVDRDEALELLTCLHPASLSAATSSATS